MTIEQPFIFNEYQLCRQERKGLNLHCYIYDVCTVTLRSQRKRAFLRDLIVCMIPSGGTTSSERSSILSLFIYCGSSLPQRVGLTICSVQFCSLKSFQILCTDFSCLVVFQYVVLCACFAVFSPFYLIYF
jgi:hypothetical protein